MVREGENTRPLKGMRTAPLEEVLIMLAVLQQYRDSDSEFVCEPVESEPEA